MPEPDGSVRFSILMWHDIVFLAPMVEFLDVMTRPAGTTGQVAEIGTRAFELIMHYMDYVWGFAHVCAPNRHLLKYDHLGQVTSEMARLCQQWQPTYERKFTSELAKLEGLDD